MDLEQVVRPVVEAAGLELVDVAFGREGGRRVLRVTVDRDGGVDLDSIAEASERISRRLDVEDFDPGPYELQVSSPGVERLLRAAPDFARSVGERVRVRTAGRVEGARTHTGTLVSAGDREVTIATDGGDRTIEYEDIASARTVFDWETELARKKRSQR
ncbi:MAG TPA: ribosome maturation factor RimP [Actinomycetota bacterium]|jgi:ribosome maturation factor RimP|nr:ribosome maturation factor RimP [Actinomycetota bacterium]